MVSSYYCLSVSIWNGFYPANASGFCFSVFVEYVLFLSPDVVDWILLNLTVFFFSFGGLPIRRVPVLTTGRIWFQQEQLQIDKEIVDNLWYWVNDGNGGLFKGIVICMEFQCLDPVVWWCFPIYPDIDECLPTIISLAWKHGQSLQCSLCASVSFSDCQPFFFSVGQSPVSFAHRH